MWRPKQPHDIRHVEYFNPVGHESIHHNHKHTHWAPRGPKCKTGVNKKPMIRHQASTGAGIQKKEKAKATVQNSGHKNRAGKQL